jgi:hypothetical protein
LFFFIRKEKTKKERTQKAWQVAGNDEKQKNGERQEEAALQGIFCYYYYVYIYIRS